MAYFRVSTFVYSCLLGARGLVELLIQLLAHTSFRSVIFFLMHYRLPSPAELQNCEHDSFVLFLIL